MTIRHSVLALALAASAQGELTLKQAEGTLTVHRGEEPLFAYRSDRGAPCLYPLHGPAGTNLTRHFPFREGVAGEEDDHPHHISFWTAHGKVNGIDFWHGKKARIVHESFGPHSTSSVIRGVLIEKASFEVHLRWEHGDQTLLREKRQYHFTARPKTYTLDVTSTLTAPEEEVTFGDTKEGTFAIRLTPSLRLKGAVAKGKMVNSEGQQDEEAWGKRARWVAYHGPDAGNHPAVVALMDHPGNLRHPTWWHARPYGLLAANPFGRHDFEGKKKQPGLGNHTLAKGETLTQRHRLLLHHGTIESARLERHFSTFAGH